MATHGSVCDSSGSGMGFIFSTTTSARAPNLVGFIAHVMGPIMYNFTRFCDNEVGNPLMMGGGLTQVNPEG